MMNKKGWLRIVEAFIAVLIIASVLLVMIGKPSEKSRGDEEKIHEIQRVILKQISNKDTLREEILRYEKQNTEEFIAGVMPTYWDFAIEICEVDELCRMSEYVEEDVYADEILISATLEAYSPKKLKLFMWRK